MQPKKTAIIAVAVLIIIGGSLAWLTSGLLGAQQSLQAIGDVGGNVSSSVNVTVYSDPGCTTNCTGINWGSVNPGSTVTRTVYIKNTGNLTETLSMAATNWSPSSASAYFTLGWDKEGTSLAAGAVVPAQLMLVVASNTGSLSNFSFTIIVSGIAKS